jgi:DNA-binding MarR family transcriptional regulator
MDLPPDLALIHQPARLKIMGLLYKHGDVGYRQARDFLGLTDGNLASHSDRLAKAGYLEARRVLNRDGFETRYRITKLGRERFREYLEALENFLRDSRNTAEP